MQVRQVRTKRKRPPLKAGYARRNSVIRRGSAESCPLLSGEYACRGACVPVSVACARQVQKKCLLKTKSPPKLFFVRKHDDDVDHFCLQQTNMEKCLFRETEVGIITNPLFFSWEIRKFALGKCNPFLLIPSYPLVPRSSSSQNHFCRQKCCCCIVLLAASFYTARGAHIEISLSTTRVERRGERG